MYPTCRRLRTPAACTRLRTDEVCSVDRVLAAAYGCRSPASGFTSTLPPCIDAIIIRGSAWCARWCARTYSPECVEGGFSEVRLLAFSEVQDVKEGGTEDG